MPNSVPPGGGHHHASHRVDPNNSSAHSEKPKSDTPHAAGGSGMTMTAFMKLFTPEQRKKFMNILVQNFVAAISKQSKKYIEELRKEREDIERGS